MKLEPIKAARQMEKYLVKLTKIERHKHHPLLHTLHKKHNISRKTLLYIKGHTREEHMAHKIIHGSLRFILLATLISALGGLALEQVRHILIPILPLIILLPAFNNMAGDFGIIVSSRLSVMLHEKQVKKRFWESEELKKLAVQVAMISMLTAFATAVLALIIPGIVGDAVNLVTAGKVVLIAVLDAFLLVSLILIISVIAGIYVFRKKKDPNNFLIPITTSIADWANMVVLALLVIMFF
ncbi:MAG: magnesium transporter [Nanoarchaeota archaeon]|nr:magnesium transporter [Nanoarchaeota archaeon]